MGDDNLGLLLPEASEAEHARLRRVITALRLLREDARAGCERRSGASWRKARSELERRERLRRWRALEGLLHAYLSALRPADSFLDLGQSPMDLATAWRFLLTGPRVPGFPPDPGEPLLSVGERLLVLLGSEGAPPATRSLWDLRLRHLRAAPGSSERSWERHFRAAVASGAPEGFQARLLSGLVAGLLECFQPTRAFELFRAHPGLAGRDLALRRLLGWAALLCGEQEQARTLLVGLPPVAVLPAPLADLRTDWPELAEVLGGTIGACRPAPSCSRAPGRAALGALLLCIVRRTPGDPRILVLDTEVALRARAEQRLSGVPLQWTPHKSEFFHRCRRRRQEPPLQQALAGARTVALVRASLTDEAGTLQGWVQIESEHQLLPSIVQIKALGRGWAEASERGAASPALVRPAKPAIDSRYFVSSDPRNAFTERLFEALAPLTGRRAYWLETDESGTECIRAERGGGLRDRESRAGRAGSWRLATDGLEFVRLRGGVDDGIHAGAAAGLAVPLLDARRTRRLGLLVLEFEHAQLLTEELVRSTRATLQALGPWWWAAAFRAWHLAHVGDDVAWGPERRYPASLEPIVRGIGGREPILLVGSPGSGRRTLARWFHFCGSNAQGPLLEGGLGEESIEGATRLLELDALERTGQVDLARRLTRGSSGRYILLARGPAQVLRERGELANELQGCLDPLPVVVPPLRERRDEIPDMTLVLAGNRARREGLAAVRFDDEVIGHLWRQDWSGGVAELAAFVARLARAHPGETIRTPELRALFRAHRMEFRARLPSLRPRMADVELALESTLHRNGSENHARAARYLGWDAATLQRRLEGVARRARGRPLRVERREAPAVSLTGASRMHPSEDPPEGLAP